MITVLLIGDGLEAALVLKATVRLIRIESPRSRLNGSGGLMA